MALDNLIEKLEKEGAKKTNKKEPVKKAPAQEATPKKSSKDDSNVFNLVIASVIILGIIGIVFGYTKDKISEIKTGGTEVTKNLEQQVVDLKQQLDALSDKASTLEKESISNKGVVIDLFDKYRSIPRKVKAENWQVLGSENLSFTISYPTDWEEVKAITPTAEGDKDKKAEIVYLQPKGQTAYINAITIKSDYADFAKLSLKEKNEIFGDLEPLDTYNFGQGKMIYFINLDKDNNEVPTVLILSDNHIYRATFNVSNKQTSDYFKYRKDFEEIISTFALIVKVDKK
ncbi:MAG: hypothetical protein AAB575_03850 [Patescibacteria group bacterium]